MGFQIPRKTARLQFEGEEFEGCEIVAALDLTFEASEHMDSLQKAEGEGKFREMLGFFADNCIISWNLTDADDNELPVSGESFLKFPGWFGLLVINGWKQAVEEVSTVNAPLPEPSKNGESSEEPSVMTEAKSSALPTSPTPSS